MGERFRLRRLIAVLRSGTALVVLASQVVIATAEHSHAPLAEEWLADESGAPQEIHEVACRTPKAIHWHADRTIEIEPCLACLRQHLVGVEVVVPPRAPVPAVSAVEPGIPRSPVAGFILDASSRGPPATS